MPGCPKRGYNYPGGLWQNRETTKQIVYLTVKSVRVLGMGPGKSCMGARLRGPSSWMANGQRP